MKAQKSTIIPFASNILRTCFGNKKIKNKKRYAIELILKLPYEEYKNKITVKKVFLSILNNIISNIELIRIEPEIRKQKVMYNCSNNEDWNLEWFCYFR